MSTRYPSSEVIAVIQPLDSIVSPMATAISVTVVEEMLPYIIRELAELAVKDMVAELIQHRVKVVRIDPFDAVIADLYDETLPTIVRRLVKETVSDAANDILKNKKSLIILQAIEEEIIRDEMYSSDIFEYALIEVDQRVALDTLLDESVDSLSREVATDALNHFEAETESAHRMFQQTAVANVIRRTLCRRILIEHLMMSIANRFGSVLLEYHVFNMAVKLITERMLSFVDAIEDRVDEVTKSDILGHAFAERTMPVIQEELIKEMLSVSREMEDAIDLFEEKYFSVSVSQQQRDEVEQQQTI